MTRRRPPTEGPEARNLALVVTLVRVAACALLVLGLFGLGVGAMEHDSRARDAAVRAAAPPRALHAGPAGVERVRFTVTTCSSFGDLIPSGPASIVAILVGALLVASSVAAERPRER